ncbi:hypothetical protein BGZ61DRAFT_483413 [Ilyonectria robusta]|uniref:uncharacterized protein n=1 Tax=Ilyonectria robusta TaxID=1079257 RepID=UPI001E8CC458|nr:uncharacterized protein BGZ61DRAFT_483413 [Ilyonectria robusta]KAH8669220.1 hypothetical protein BGZ61DRAFT_483413 [Ilyonectria robusta]
MGPAEIIIVTTISIFFWGLPAVLTAHILFVNATHKWPRLKADIRLWSLAIIAASMLALCWPIALVLLCLISLGSCAFASHSTRHGGSRNAWLSLAWVPLAWARIKTGCRRRMHKTEKVTVEQRADVENQIANHLQSKTQPEPVSTADERDTGNFNYDSSRPGPPVGIMNGTGVARYAHRSCQTNQDAAPPTYEMALEESVNRAAIPNDQPPLPAYSA